MLKDIMSGKNEKEREVGGVARYLNESKNPWQLMTKLRFIFIGLRTNNLKNAFLNKPY